MRFFLAAAALCLCSFSPQNVQEKSLETYAIDSKPSKAIIGIACRTSNQLAFQDLPKHWEKFWRENIIDQIPNKTSSDIIALYCDYEGDYTQPYTHVIGCEVDLLTPLPEGMVAKIIPSGSYAVFQAIGKQPEATIEKWIDIWKDPSLKRTYTGDYEVYGERFFSDGQVDIFIAIDE
jgi:predicted transcriptional regulator YdeE